MTERLKFGDKDSILKARQYERRKEIAKYEKKLKKTECAHMIMNDSGNESPCRRTIIFIESVNEETSTVKWKACPYCGTVNITDLHGGYKEHYK